MPNCRASPAQQFAGLVSGLSTRPFLVQVFGLGTTPYCFPNTLNLMFVGEAQREGKPESRRASESFLWAQVVMGLAAIYCPPIQSAFKTGTGFGDAAFPAV